MSKADAVIADKNIKGTQVHSIKGGSCYVMIYDKKSKEIKYLHFNSGGLIETKVHGTDREVVLFDDEKERDDFIASNGLKYSQALLREI